MSHSPPPLLRLTVRPLAVPHHTSTAVLTPPPPRLKSQNQHTSDVASHTGRPFLAPFCNRTTCNTALDACPPRRHRNCTLLCPAQDCNCKLCHLCAPKVVSVLPDGKKVSNVPLKGWCSQHLSSAPLGQQSVLGTRPYCLVVAVKQDVAVAVFRKYSTCRWSLFGPFSLCERCP